MGWNLGDSFLGPGKQMNHFGPFGPKIPHILKKIYIYIFYYFKLFLNDHFNDLSAGQIMLLGSVLFFKKILISALLEHFLKYKLPWSIQINPELF